VATASDSFARANGALGANWTPWSWSGSAGAVIASDQVQGIVGGTAGDFWSAASFGASQFSQVTVAVPPASGSWVGVTVRQAAPGSGYLGIWFNGSFYIFNENASSSPPQLATVAGTLTAGDTLAIQASGTTVSLLHNGTQVLSVTSALYAAGAPGLAFFGATGMISAWRGGDISTLAVATTSLANVVSGTGVRRWLSASGGTPPYAWSLASGSLPAGLALGASGALSGTPSGTGASSFTAQVTDSAANSVTAPLSVTSVSAPLAPATPSTDGNGVVTWQVTSAVNGNDAETIRVLPPSAPSGGYPHGFLVTMPVAAGTDDTSFGNGLDTVRALGLHNTYNLTVVEPSIGGNWLADNPANAALLQETYLLQVVAWARANYGSGGEKVYLIGLSRTGIAGQGLFFHWPDVYAGVASWDFPAAMTGYTGTDPNGTVGGSPGTSYGTQDNFAANYQLTAANIETWTTGRSPGRVWVGGYSAFQADVTSYDPVLTAAGVAHTYAPVAASEHNWAPSPGWVAPALASLLGPPASRPGVSWASAYI
jgi:Putative Ig domain